MNKGKDFKFLGQWISLGYSFKRIGFGFSIDKYALQLDFLFFWFGWEFK